MRKNTLNIFNLMIIALVIFELWLLYTYYTSGNKYEAILALINALLIPFILYLRNRYSKKANIGNLEETKFKEANNKAKLSVIVDCANVKYLGKSGQYRVHINFRMGAENKDIFLSEFRVKCDSSNGISGADTIFGENGEKLKVLYSLVETDLLALVDEEYNKYIETKKQNLLKVLGFKIPRDSWVFFSLYNDINSERWPDGFEELPIKGWKFVIEYNEGLMIDVPFNLEIHKSNPRIPIKWRDEGF